MTKEEMITVLQRVLKTDADPEFLTKLEVKELEILIASVRDCVESRSNLS
jgi:hypothetical protein